MKRNKKLWILVVCALCCVIVLSVALLASQYVLEIWAISYGAVGQPFMEWISPYDADWIFGKTQEEIIEKYGDFDYRDEYSSLTVGYKIYGTNFCTVVNFYGSNESGEQVASLVTVDSLFALGWGEDNRIPAQTVD